MTADPAPPPSSPPVPDPPAEPAGPAPSTTPLLTRRRLLIGAGGAAVAGAVGWAALGRDGGDGQAASTTTGSTASTRPAPSTTRPTTAPTTAPAPTAPPTPTFDVREFGARGDGRTDDSASLRAALDAALVESRHLNEGADPAAAARAPTVVVPAGHYLCPGLIGVNVDAPLSIRGEGTAVLDAVDLDPERVLHGIAPVLSCTSAIDVEGLELRQGGVWLSFASMTHDTALLRIAACTFRGGRAPASAWPGGDPVPHGPDRLVVEGNVVEGTDARDLTSCTYGFGLELMRWGSAVVRDNRVSGVFQHGIRVGHQARNGRPYSDRPDLTCSGNVVDRVWGTVKSNGIVLAASDLRITDNQVDHVTSGRDESRGVGDTEGIYVKGHGIVVSGNTLTDGGRLQAQITVKGSDAVVEGNRITNSEGVSSGGIRVEGTGTEIRGNHLLGIPRGCDAISVQGDASDDTIVVADNVIEGGRPEHAISISRRSIVVVTANRIVGAPAEKGAIVVRTSGDGPIDRVEIRRNEIRDAGRTDGVVIAARDAGGEVRRVEVLDNAFHDVDRAVRALAWDGGAIGSVVLEGNTYESVSHPIDADEDTAVTRTD